MNNIIDFRGKTPLKIGLKWGGNIPALSAMNVKEGKIEFNEETHYGSMELYKKWMTKGDCEKGDIVLTMEAPMGNVAKIPDNQKYILSQRVLLLKFNEKIVSKNYMYQYLRSPYFKKQMNRYATGTTAKGIKQRNLIKIKLNIPSLDKQKFIGNFLEVMDQKIELMEKTLNQNINEKKYYLQNLFPKENNVPYLRFYEFNENWKNKKIKDILSIHGRIGFRGYTQKDFVNQGEGALTIGAKHINSYNEIDLKEPEYISWKKYYESPEIMIQKGNILLSKTGTIGKIALIDKKIGKATINPNVVLLNEFKVNEKFLYYLMSTNDFKKELLRKSTTTSVPMVNQENINKISVKIPTIAEQKQIANVLSIIDEKIYLNKNKLNQLKIFKKGLLQKMFI